MIEKKTEKREQRESLGGARLIMQKHSSIQEYQDSDEDPFDDLFELKNDFDGYDSDDDKEDQPFSHLKSATFVGTPAYASPEML